MIIDINTNSTKYCRMLVACYILLLTNIHIQAQQINLTRSKVLFDSDWLFHKGGAQGADQPGFDDAGWRKIDLPHDWSIEDLPIGQAGLPGTHSPFEPNAITQVSGAFTTNGTGWYRKNFVIPISEKGRIIQILFDGVYMNADIWLNGQHLGNHPYGYTSFWYDITDKIKIGENNELAVQVKNNGLNSRWYSGSGIDRHVWLSFTKPIYIAPWGVVINTPQSDDKTANITIKTSLKNETDKASDVTLITHIIDKLGYEVKKVSIGRVIGAHTDYQFEYGLIIPSPQLWSVDTPNLYTAVTEVYSGKELTDKVETKFGIRSISFDAVNGFRLNGKSLKLKGGCFHIDNGPLGTKSYDRAEQRRVALMKASGFNAIRCSHNPPAPAFLDACDSLGMLVIDEAFDMWEEEKTPFDYHLYFDKWWKKDIQSMISRDQNHPSIIMWSIGNEIPGMDNPNVVKVAHQLADYVHSIDNTRPVTAAVNSVSEKKDPFFSALDVCGYNYALDNYVSDHQRKPERIMFATESFPLEAFDYWMAVIDHPWVIGDFVWTGFDYIGEASIGWLGYPQEKNFYPWNLAYCGDIDICGWKRPQSFYRDALWKKNQLSIFVKPLQPSFPVNPKKEPWSKWNWDDVVANWTWNGDEDSTFDVNIYSSCDEVELFLNNKSLGKKPTNRSTKFMAVYNVPYTAGELKAVGYDNGKKVNTAILKTAGEPTQIKLSADRKIIKADNQDLSYITVELVDKNGIRNPNAENLVHFEIEGTGTIAGVGNANPVSVESYQLPKRKAWHGRCLVVIKSKRTPGNIILKAISTGLNSSEVIIKSK